MDTDVVEDAISSHLTLLQDLFTWALILAVAVAWAGLRRDNEISVGALKVERKLSFYVVAFLYLSVTLVGLIVLWRLEALLKILPDAKFVSGYTRLATHEWVMNPFAYLGTSGAANKSAMWGTGILIVGWWVCLASVYSLRGGNRELKSLLFPMLFLFYAAGLYSLWSIYQIYILNLDRLQALQPELFDGLKQTRGARWVVIFAAVPIGILVFLLILRLPLIFGRHTPAASSRSSQDRRG